MRGEECLEKIEWTVKHCGMRRDHADECIKAKDFMKENPQFRGFSTAGVLPLINEQDPKIKQKVISDVGKAVEHGRQERDYGTEQKMKKAIARYKEVEPEKPKEVKPVKLWNMVEQAEYARLFVKTMMANGANPASIRELVVKAIGVVEQE